MMAMMQNVAGNIQHILQRQNPHLSNEFFPRRKCHY